MKSNGDGEQISGETLIDLSGILDKSITTRKLLNEAEAFNIAECYANYFVDRISPQKAPFTFRWFFTLHGEMFGRVWDWAGKPRKTDLNLGCPWHQVESQVIDLVDTLPYWKSMPHVEQAARLHHRAVSIHPFLNGNGRWSRMLANIWLRRNRARRISWPEPRLGEPSDIRTEYIEAVQAADRGDYGPLIRLHERFSRAQ